MQMNETINQNFTICKINKGTRKTVLFLGNDTLTLIPKERVNQSHSWGMSKIFTFQSVICHVLCLKDDKILSFNSSDNTYCSWEMRTVLSVLWHENCFDHAHGVRIVSSFPRKKNTFHLFKRWWKLIILLGMGCLIRSFAEKRIYDFLSGRL